MFNKIINKIKQFGVIIAVILAVKAVIRTLFKFSWTSYYLMSCTSINEYVMMIKNNINFYLKPLIRKDLFDGLYDEIFEFDRKSKKEFFKQRLDNPQIEGFGIFSDKKLVCYGWIDYEKLVIKKSRIIPLPFKSALLLDDYCHPAYRRRGFHSYMNAYRIKRIFERNMEKVYVLVVKYNVPAIKTQRKCGLEIEKSFTHFKIGKKEYCTLKEI
jgi:ribosomal protein S18 acetylase RimI-like enzyme